MAPTTQLIRIGELEAKAERFEVLFKVVERDQKLLETSMDGLKADISIMKAALFGDPADPKHKPGLVNEVSRLEMKLDQTNGTLEGIRKDLRWATLIVVGAVITGLLKLLFLH